MSKNLDDSDLIKEFGKFDFIFEEIFLRLALNLYQMGLRNLTEITCINSSRLRSKTTAKYENTFSEVLYQFLYKWSNKL